MFSSLTAWRVLQFYFLFLSFKSELNLYLTEIKLMGTRLSLKKLFQHSTPKAFLLAVFCIFGLSVHQAKAQNVCPQTLFDDSYEIFIEGSFVNKTFSRTHTSIHWKHHKAAPDSFFIVFPNSSAKDTTIFLTDGNFRRLILPGKQIFRGIATHHLKENIGDSPLYYDDLDLLANGQFLCPDSTQPPAPNKFGTAFSQMWYHLTADKVPEPSELGMSGSKGQKRKISIIAWKQLGSINLPTAIRITGNNYYGMAWVHSAYAINDKKDYKDPIREFFKSGKPETQQSFTEIKKSKPVLVLDLNNKLLGNASIIKPFLSTAKDTGSNSNTLVPFVP